MPLIFCVLYRFFDTISTLDKRNTKILLGPELLSRDLKLENAIESHKDIDTSKIERNLSEGRHKIGPKFCARGHPESMCAPRGREGLYAKAY